ncbi:MAG: hypothetical protein WCF17_21135 [Terracidiphilus sp.]
MRSPAALQSYTRAMQESPDQEWRRLTGHYAGMYDGELLELTHDYKSLTEMAQQVLRDEMKKRGLGEPLSPRPKMPAKAASQRVSETASQRERAVRPVDASATDPRAEQDRLRFAQHYGTLCDEDLLDLSDNWESLTAGAQLALGQELERRGLGSVGAMAEAQDEEENGALARAEAEMTAQNPHDGESESGEPGEYTWKVELSEYETRAEALQRMEMLRRAGIESWFLNPAAYFADPFAAPATYRIAVAADQLEEAHRIVAQPVPADIVEQSQATAPEFEMPRCPRCRAADPVLTDAEPCNKWLCESCGHEWDDPVSDDDQP